VEDRDAEEHQHRVADHLVDGPAVQLHDPPHLLEVAAHDLLERLGVVSLGERREATDVREHHRDDLAPPDRPRRVVAQERAARRAEARLVPRRRSAPGARWHGASLRGPDEGDLVHFHVAPSPAGGARRQVSTSSGSPGQVTYSVPAHGAGPGANASPVSTSTSHHHSRSWSSRRYSREVPRPRTPFWVTTATIASRPTSAGISSQFSGPAASTLRRRSLSVSWG